MCPHFPLTDFIREGLKKKKKKLGVFAQVRGGDGSEGVPGPQPRAKLAGWRNWQGDEMGRVMNFPGD